MSGPDIAMVVVTIFGIVATGYAVYLHFKNRSLEKTK